MNVHSLRLRLLSSLSTFYFEFLLILTTTNTVKNGSNNQRLCYQRKLQENYAGKKKEKTKKKINKTAQHTREQSKLGRERAYLISSQTSN